MSTTHNKTAYRLFQFLWVIIIMPKYLQFFLLSFWAFYLIYTVRGKLNLNKVMIPFILYAAVHTFSIMINSFGNQDNERLIAAFNTMAMWIIAVINYTYYQVVPVELKKVGKCMIFNISVLLVFTALMFLLPQNINIPILERRLFRTDWFYGERTTRLNAFMEHSNLVVWFVLLTLPTALCGLKSRRVKYLFILICLLPVLATNSRTGILIMGIIIICEFSLLLDRRYRVPMGLAVLCVFLVILLLQGGNIDIIEKIGDLIGARPGSTNTRLGLYRDSIEITLRQSPFLGMGIKELKGSYPLGSHSSYIGFFYKTGVIGLVCVLIGLVRLNYNTVKSLKKENHGWSILILFFAILGAMTVKDIDGTNWVITLFFVNHSIFTKNSATLPGEPAESNALIRRGKQAFMKRSVKIVNKNTGVSTE